MELKLDQENCLIIDPKNGCKINQLKLGGKTIINADPKIQGFLSTGSYLMYPWVNRVLQNPYQKTVKNPFSDGKAYPLHGLYANTQRIIEYQNQQQQNQIKIFVKNFQAKPQIHDFYQNFFLSKNTFQIQFQSLQSANDQNPFCFGYHPYFQLSEPVAKLQFQTNLTKQIKLREDLVVGLPVEFQQWNGLIDGNKKYDTLFMSEEQYSQEKLSTYVILSDGVNILKIESNLQYWQIYTPPDGKRIAIQPMSFHGNLYQAMKKDNTLKEKLPKSGKIRITMS